MTEVELYELHWNQFRGSCEKRAKAADVFINNKGWQKLREFHLEYYLKGLKNPFGFLFEVKLRHKPVYNGVKCMPRYYYHYLKLRQRELDLASRDVVEFPTWRRI